MYNSPKLNIQSLPCLPLCTTRIPILLLFGLLIGYGAFVFRRDKKSGGEPKLRIDLERPASD